MPETILKIQDVVKTYGQRTVIDHVSLEIKRGMIYGLIGENGAGKSTIMRLIMGLTHYDSGEITLFGQHDSAGLRAGRRKIGQSIETPALYPELSAYRNMAVQAANAGVGEQEIPELLDQMGLADTGKKKVKNFSLGMRQRLAIAQTLISHPELLILDEPINGLDPAGIIEIRNIIQKLATERGMTVLISSHILDELSQVATDYGILHHGQLIQELSKDQLQEKSRRYIDLEVADTQRAVVVLDQAQIRDYSVIDDRHLQIFTVVDIPQLNRQLVAAGIDVYRIGMTNQKLEDYFMSITEG